MNNNNMHMVHAPPKTSIMDRPLETHHQRNASPANAYLQHLQSKKSSINTKSNNNNYGSDPRQTITSPTLRNKISSIQQGSQKISSPVASRTTPNNNKNWMPTTNPGVSSGTADVKKLPRGSPTISTGTPQNSVKQRHGNHRGGSTSRSKDKSHKSKSAKPPLCNQKFPRSTISSEATNSTYLSSESDEEDASTATATVHSDGTSSFQSGHSQRRRKSRSCIHDYESSSRSNGSSPRNYPPENENHHHHLRPSNAIVPYQPNDQFDEDAYTTDNNSTNYYFNTENQHQQQHHDHHHQYSQFYDNNSNSNNTEMFHEDADAFSYSDEDEYYFHQQQQRTNNYNNNDDVEEDDDDNDDTLAVDLDQLIEEASARWKLTVSETVQNTVTATSFGVASHQHHQQNMIGVSPTLSTTPVISPLLRRQYMDALALGVGVAPTISSPDFGMNNDANSNNNTALLVAPVNPNVMYPDIVATTSSSSSQLIQEQQSEIEALRAELQKHQQQQQQQLQHNPSPPSNPPIDIALSQQHQQQQQHPIHPIQVLTVATDHHTIDDDLTVWSGFQSTTGPPIQHRPDADGNCSIIGDGNINNNYSRPMSTSILLTVNHNHKSSTSRVPQQPPRPPQTIRLELSSIVTGITRTAIFTGMITSKNLPTNNIDDSFTTFANHSITGSGVLQFIETGDVYRGDIVHSEMHGYGTYTFGTNNNNSNQQQQQVLRGRFEHNVFIGE